MTVVSYRHGIIFLKTRKTAGTSLELWLSSIAGDCDVLTPLEPQDEVTREDLGSGARNIDIPVRRYRPRDGIKRLLGRRPYFVNHMPARDVRQAVGEAAWRSFLKVTIERDRYDRAVSMFRWHTRDQRDPDLGEFLRALPPRKLANAPIYSIDGEVVADVVLDFADLASDVALLQRALGLPLANLPRSKVSRSARTSSLDLLGDEGRRIVDAACAHDVGLERPDKRAEVVFA